MLASYATHKMLVVLHVVNDTLQNPQQFLCFELMTMFGVFSLLVSKLYRLYLRSNENGQITSKTPRRLTCLDLRFFCFVVHLDITLLSQISQNLSIDVDQIWTSDFILRVLRIIKFTWGFQTWNEWILWQVLAYIGENVGKIWLFPSVEFTQRLLGVHLPRVLFPPTAVVTYVWME